MYVFRIHIRPTGGTADPTATFDYCLRNGVLGVGWRTTSNRSTKNWDDYYTEASKQYDDLRVCKYIKKWVSPGDLVWTRDTKSNYYLARVKSGWEYWATKESKELDIDIGNIFRCDIKRVDLYEVPGKVVASFRAGRTIQEIADPKASEFSRHLWNAICDRAVYKVDKGKYSDIFMMLDDEETEDLVFLYLQSLGWYIVPNSRKKDTMRYEFLSVLPATGEAAAVQVKTGKSVIDKDEYSQSQEKVFLFQSNGLYSGSDNKNIEVIDRDKLLEFLHDSIEWIPRIFKRKLELVSP